MTLLIVDGSNLIMRAAFGGDIEPDRAVPIATGLIMRAARQVAATHLVVALDSAGPSWRAAESPSYKANRTRDTMPWIQAASEEWKTKGWRVVAVEGFEADDIIATLASRARERHKTFVLSGDSDLFTLTAFGFGSGDVAARLIHVLKPVNGGKFEHVTGVDVCGKYKIPTPAALTDFKAMTGEKGDNVAGVPGIGPVRASKLLAAHLTLEGVILAGQNQKCRDSQIVAKHEAAARAAFKLLSLTFTVPIDPIQPKECAL